MIYRDVYRKKKFFRQVLVNIFLELLFLSDKIVTIQIFIEDIKQYDESHTENPAFYL